MRKQWAFAALSVTLLGAGGFYAAEYIKLEKVDAEVRAWQTRLSSYVAFDYEVISTRLGVNAVSLENVYVTYPVLMSIQKLTFTPPDDENILENWEIAAEGIQFTVPSLDDTLAWQGNVFIHYAYDTSIQQLHLEISSDFQNLLTAEFKTTLQHIVPNIDLVFTYPDVLLADLAIEVKNKGFLQEMGYGNSNDTSLTAWMQQFTQKNQRQAFHDFWLKGLPLSIQFSPEYPVPFYRLLENDRLFWQHPAVVMQTLP